MGLLIDFKTKGVIRLLSEQAFANAFTAVSLGVYVVCRVLSLIAPDFLFDVGKSWFHTFSLESMRAVAPFDMGTFIFGAVTLAILVWITAYSGATLYNKWAK